MTIQQLRDQLELVSDLHAHARTAELIQMLDLGEAEILEEEDELVSIEGRNGRRIQL